MNSKYFIIPIIFIVYLIGIFYFFPIKSSVYNTDELKNFSLDIKSDENKFSGKITPTEDKKIQVADENADKKIEGKNTASSSAETNVTVGAILNVPFTPQAPFAEWDNPIFQDGCEEAASLMAVRWARGENLSKEEAKNEIIKISDYEAKNFGEYRDTSAEDTVLRIIKGYFGYDKAEARNNISVDDIIGEISRGNLVIAPMDGRKLGNPFYNPPGPERHMLVVRGYDAEKKEFITNDAGTKNGEKYRYKEDVLFGAIRDYLTGYHKPISNEIKAIIVIKK